MNKFVWYSEGVHFGCTQCGRCCTGGPGAVWVSDQDLQTMAQYLQISPEEFEQRYTRLLDGRRALRETGSDYDCIFLENKKACKVYPVRPLQCQTFPFWPGIMSSKSQWENTSMHCEGIHKDAPIVSYEYIEQQLARHRLSD